jgi:sensor histidine kinase YesM
MLSLIKKFLYRSIVAFGIFLFFNISNSESVESFLTWDNADTAYLIFVVGVVHIVWGICDLVIRWFERNRLVHSFNKGKLAALFLLDFGITLPVILVATYFSAFHMKHILNAPEDMIGDTRILFLSETVQAIVLSSLIMFWELLNLYYKHTNKIEQEKAEMQKELLLSKYESLKNQVNPHFLFNSFSVLSSLIEVDRAMAGKFLSQLSRLYRYILDNKDHQMVDLAKELDFLKSYIFLLKTRHESAIDVSIRISDDHLKCSIPTLSLQMLIENAVKHNNFSKEEPLFIEIRAEGDYLVVKNRINRKNASIHSTKIGLENIRKRYSFESSKDVVVENDESFFTVKLPIINQLSFS